MIRHPFLLASLVIAALVLGPVHAQQATPARATGLQIVTPPVLVDCAPVTVVPCMGMSVTAVDSAGRPAPVAFTPGEPLKQSLSLISGEGTEVTPFYASAGSGLDAGEHRNVVLLMIDISGSMKEPSPGAPSRFAAVKSAIARYLDSMQEGTDEIAIVPFESHNVVPTIRSAVFSSHKAELLQQLNALPEPGPKNNTALYQAVFSGVDTMKQEMDTLEREGLKTSDLQPHIVVMTDGTNEVHPGDDPQLLDGPLGLQQASAQVASSHMDVVGVGFGDRAAINAADLQRLSTRLLYAADAGELLRALHGTRAMQSHVITFTWLLDVPSRIALTGRDEVWTPGLTLDDGSILRSGPLRTMPPATAPPIFTRVASAPELAALIATHPPASAGWTVLLIHLILFVIVGTLLVMLWFWIPRLIWGHEVSAPTPTRWSNTPGTGDRSGITVASGVQIRKSSVPAGFTVETQPAAPLQRSPSQTTQVGARPDPNRTRLNFD
jgi:hypothetical protein